MRPDQIDRFYREYRGLGRLIGVRERDLPDDYASFTHYFKTTCEEQLVRTASVDRVIEATQGEVPAPLPMPDLRGAPRACPPGARCGSAASGC